MKLEKWMKIKSLLIVIFGEQKNILSPEKHLYIEKYNPKNLHDDLKDIIPLKQDNLWTADAEVLNYLWNLCIKGKPKVIIEFGSGLSTILFSHYFNKFPNEKNVLVSLDQDEVFLKRTLEQIEIKNSGFNHFPILSKTKPTGYIIDQDKLREVIIQYGKIDLIFIDGPFGNYNARLDTLLDILNFTNNSAVWVLDDAFRDSEIEILNRWNRNINIKANGILNIGGGIGIGVKV
ncbi:MAG: hypothetical protein ACQETL_17515 [Bacteroidota bacterium]